MAFEGTKGTIEELRQCVTTWEEKWSDTRREKSQPGLEKAGDPVWFFLRVLCSRHFQPNVF